MNDDDDDIYIKYYKMSIRKHSIAENYIYGPY